MRSSCRDEDELLRLVDGQLSESDAKELRAHAAACPKCGALLADVERAVRALAAPVEGTDTNAAIERWIDENNLRPNGPPWEWYVTDPGEHPNPADWRTEVYWPLAE